MDFSIQGSRPIWQQLTEQLARRIITGAYPLGSRFPAVRELAAEAGVNPNTMQRALQQLEREGLVFTQRSSGRFITEDTAAIGEAKRTLARQHIEQFMASMKKLGYTREEIIALLEGGEEEDKNGSML
mgnify:FL=1